MIGLEVHVQLATADQNLLRLPDQLWRPGQRERLPRVFGPARSASGLEPGQRVELAIQASLAMHCRVNGFSRFARKNYFYPDLPKGYQISQYDQPLAEHGWLEMHAGEWRRKRIGVTRVHMEDDAGKSIHDGFKDSDRYTYVDLNRSGTPLIEIVSEPDMRSSDEAHAYLTELKLAMQFIGVSECDMEKGQLRCDANVSVRRKGAEKFGTKAEVKNLNSFRYAKMALDYEIGAAGGVARKRRQGDPGNPALQRRDRRNGEHAQQGACARLSLFPGTRPRPPASERSAWLERMQQSLPELPADKRRLRFIRSNTACASTTPASSRPPAPMSEYFERAAKASSDPKATANWVTGDLAGALKGARHLPSRPVTAENLGELVSLIASGEISGKMAKDIFARMFETGDSARAIMEREGLKQISDTGALEARSSMM